MRGFGGGPPIQSLENPIFSPPMEEAMTQFKTLFPPKGGAITIRPDVEADR